MGKSTRESNRFTAWSMTFAVRKSFLGYALRCAEKLRFSVTSKKYTRLRRCSQAQPANI